MFVIAEILIFKTIGIGKKTKKIDYRYGGTSCLSGKRKKNIIIFWSVQKEGGVFFMFLYYTVVKIMILYWWKSLFTKSRVLYTKTPRIYPGVTIGQIASITSQF